MKLGLDIHGVITKKPEFFSILTDKAVQRGHEIHILTGALLTDTKIKELEAFGISWTHLFSISEYHKHLGTPMTFTAPNNPWIDPILWDRTKGDYCARNKITFHVDDTLRYGDYFSTPFAWYNSEENKAHWFVGLDRKGTLVFQNPEETLSVIEGIAEGLIKEDN